MDGEISREEYQELMSRYLLGGPAGGDSGGGVGGDSSSPEWGPTGGDEYQRSRSYSSGPSAAELARRRQEQEEQERRERELRAEIERRERDRFRRDRFREENLEQGEAEGEELFLDITEDGVPKRRYAKGKAMPALDELLATGQRRGGRMTQVGRQEDFEDDGLIKPPASLDLKASAAVTGDRQGEAEGFLEGREDYRGALLAEQDVLDERPAVLEDANRGEGSDADGRAALDAKRLGGGPRSFWDPPGPVDDEDLALERLTSQFLPGQDRARAAIEQNLVEEELRGQDLPKDRWRIEAKPMPMPDEGFPERGEVEAWREASVDGEVLRSQDVSDGSARFKDRLQVQPKPGEPGVPRKLEDRVGQGLGEEDFQERGQVAKVEAWLERSREGSLDEEGLRGQFVPMPDVPMPG